MGTTTLTALACLLVLTTTGCTGFSTGPIDATTSSPPATSVPATPPVTAAPGDSSPPPLPELQNLPVLVPETTGKGSSTQPVPVEVGTGTLWIDVTCSGAETITVDMPPMGSYGVDRTHPTRNASTLEAPSSMEMSVVAAPDASWRLRLQQQGGRGGRGCGQRPVHVRGM